jgi:integrase
MVTILLSDFMQSGIDELTSNRRYGTAHVHKSVLHSVIEFADNRPLYLHELTPQWLKSYENFLLLEKERSANTSSTYLRCLQTIYNRALQSGLVEYIPGQFKQIFTGTKHNHSRALSAAEIRRLVADTPVPNLPASDRSASDRLSFTMRARACMELMLRLRGIAFVDLAFLPKTAVRENVLVVKRRKTGRILRFRITREVRALLRNYAHRDPASPFLLDILHDHDNTDRGIYLNYQRQLRNLNRFLKLLASSRHLSCTVSSYCARHTWATQAKYCGISTAIISEGLGHASVTTTEAYLKSFAMEVLEEANKVVISNILKKNDEKE